MSLSLVVLIVKGPIDHQAKIENGLYGDSQYAAVIYKDMIVLLL